jgi:hypothetical protein
MPKTVNNHACGEWVVFHVCHVFGEFEAAASRGVEGPWIERVEETARDDLGGLFVVTTNEERGVFGIGFNDAGDAGGKREFGFEVAVTFKQWRDGCEREFFGLD